MQSFMSPSFVKSRGSRYSRTCADANHTSVLKCKALVNKRDAHTALAHTARHPLDRIVTHVTRAKDSLQIGFEQEGRTLMRPGKQIAASANKPFSSRCNSVGIQLVLACAPIMMKSASVFRRTGLP